MTRAGHSGRYAYMSAQDAPQHAKRTQNVDLVNLAGSLVLLECEDLAAALETGRQLAVSALGAASADLIVAEPAGDRWTAAEVEDLVLRPSRRAADERLVVLVARANRMDGAAADKLLKEVEEPAGEALFIFAVDETDSMKPAIRGRAALHLQVQAPSRGEIAAGFVAAGFPEDVAADLAAATMPSPRLRQALVDLEEDVRSALVHAVTRLPYSQTPFGTSAHLLAALEAAAKDGGATRTTMKGEQRQLLRELIRCWTAMVAAGVGRTPEGVAQHEQLLRRLQQAERFCSGHANPQAVAAYILNTP